MAGLTQEPSWLALRAQSDEWYDAPLHSWEDNTRLIASESPNSGGVPRSLAYFVGVFPDADDIPQHPDPQISQI